MPESLPDALKLWQKAPDGTRLILGATDILPWAREGRAGDVRLPAVIDLSRVRELSGFKVTGEHVQMGANTVFQEFLTNDTLKTHLPCMPYCAVWFADDQIREQATLTGNVVNASPAADGTPPLLAMNGQVEIARLENGSTIRRAVDVGHFVAGPGQVDLKPGEIVTSIVCDSLKGYGGSFQKVGQRRSLVISTVCAAACVKLDASGTAIVDLRLALGGIGPVPVRLNEIENFLRGRSVSSVCSMDDWALPEDLVASRTRREYRRSVSKAFVRTAIEDAVADFRKLEVGASQLETGYA